MVALAKQLRRRGPRGDQRSLREVAAELARLGHFNQRRKVFSSSAIASMVGWRVMPRTKAPGKATRRRASRTTVPAPQQPVTVAVEPSVGDPIAAPRPASGITLVEFSLLWLVGLVYSFVTSPAGMTPLPVAAGWIILGTTIVSLIVLGKRFPKCSACSCSW